MNSNKNKLTEDKPLSASKPVRSFAQKILILPIRAYQLLISPVLGNNCRFYPSCSQYTIQAIETHGTFKGLWLGSKRIIRCHPWNDGGIDPVPPCCPNEKK